MKKEKQSVMQWIGNHKKELIIVGVGAVVVGVSVYAVAKNPQILGNSVKSFIRKTTGTILTQKSNVFNVADVGSKIIPMRHSPHEVARHIRNLPNGQVASIEQLKYAAEQGIKLGKHQTIVRPYVTNGYVV